MWGVRPLFTEVQIPRLERNTTVLLSIHKGGVGQAWPLTYDVKMSLPCLMKPLPQSPGVCIFGESLKGRDLQLLGLKSSHSLSTSLSVLTLISLSYPSAEPTYFYSTKPLQISRAFPQSCYIPLSGLFEVKLLPPLLYPRSPSPSCQAPLRLRPARPPDTAAANS